MKAFFDLVLPSRGIRMLAAGKGKPHREFKSEETEELIRRAATWSDQKLDVFFACASYESPIYHDGSGDAHFRTADNAILARSFWLDVDVGKPNAYPDQPAAISGIKAFCSHHALPLPMLVSSGHGIHCYWPLEEDVEKAVWLPAARQFKALTRSPACPFRVDQSRTGDIASLLRPIGTRNFKRGGEGSPVQLLRAVSPIPFHSFRQAVEAAHSKIDRGHRNQDRSSLSATPTLAELESALAAIDPDKGGRSDWWRSLAAIGDAYGEAGRDLARRWSQGDLQGVRSGEFDEADFERQFTDIVERRSSYSGPRATLATIFAEARRDGWEPGWFEEMNRGFAWITRAQAIYRLDYHDFTKPAQLREQFANRSTIMGSGAKARSVSIADAWMRHPERREHAELALVPNGPQVLDDNRLNTWRGFAVSPSPGDVQPFQDLLRRLFPDLEAEHFILMWMAHLLQHPEIKMHVAPVIWSRAQGVGKNLLFECLTAIIGRTHAGIIGQADLAGDFNGWARDMIFVVGDEVIGEDRRQHVDKVKGLVTGATIQINVKFQPAIEVPNLVNFVFLSNNPTAMFVEDQDRRYFVWEVAAEPMAEHEVRTFVSWRDGGGLAALHHWLETLPISNFNPKARAPVTAAMRQMASANLTDLEAFAEQVMTSGAQQVIGRELATTDELADFYVTATGRNRPHRKALHQAFTRQGAYAYPHQIRVGGVKIRAIAVGRPQHWRKCEPSEWAKELSRSLRPGMARSAGSHLRLMTGDGEATDLTALSGKSAA